MAHPNMTCMYVNVWLHHMQVDELFDFLNERIETSPPYWLNMEDAPYSISGGYIMISLPYDSYSKLRFDRNWDQ